MFYIVLNSLVGYQMRTRNLLVANYFIFKVKLKLN